MVTTRDRKSFGSCIAEKITNVAQTTGAVDFFHPRSIISGPTLRRVSSCSNFF